MNVMQLYMLNLRNLFFTITYNLQQQLLKWPKCNLMTSMRLLQDFLTQMTTAKLLPTQMEFCARCAASGECIRLLTKPRRLLISLRPLSSRT